MYKIEIEGQKDIYDVLPVEGTERYDIYENEGSAIGTIWPVLSINGVEWHSDNIHLSEILINKIGEAIEMIER